MKPIINKGQKTSVKPKTVNAKQTEVEEDIQEDLVEETDQLADVFGSVTVEDAIRDSQGYTKIPYLVIPDKKSVTGVFLDTSPLTFYQHQLFDPNLKNGQGGTRNLTCPRKNCPACQAGSKPTFKGAYRFVQVDYVDDNGDIVPTERLFLKGVKTVEQLEHKNRKRALDSALTEIERRGSGFDTTYYVEFVDGDMPEGYDPAPYADLDELKALLAPDMKKLAELSQYISASKQGAGQQGRGFQQRSQGQGFANRGQGGQGFNRQQPKPLGRQQQQPQAFEDYEDDSPF